MHEVLVNHLGDLSLPRKSVVRLTDRPDMTLDVYRIRKTTTQQQQQIKEKTPFWKDFIIQGTLLHSERPKTLWSLGNRVKSRPNFGMALLSREQKLLLNN